MQSIGKTPVQENLCTWINTSRSAQARFQDETRFPARPFGVHENQTGPRPKICRFGALCLTEGSTSASHGWRPSGAKGRLEQRELAFGPRDETGRGTAEHEVLAAGAHGHAVVEPRRVGAGIVAVVGGGLLTVGGRSALERRGVDQPVGPRLGPGSEPDAQPPKAADDRALVRELMESVPLMSVETLELGITGGEPTLLGADFIRLLSLVRDCLPHTSLHVLSNGRLFSYRRLAERVAQVRHPDLMIGIPLYSDLPDLHDFVVQASGAFEQTIRGLLNLGRFGVPIELRVVVHRQTYERLPELGEFIARNLPFVHQVALMGLEMMGYVKMNLEGLWIDPVDYQPQLKGCVEALNAGRVKALVFNHQLCTLDRSLWPYARKTISDWKNIYMPECNDCLLRGECGGFFASAGLRYSRGIRPLRDTQMANGR